MTAQQEKDLISFTSEIPQTQRTIEEDPYNKLKESILKLNSSATHHQQQQQQNLQLIPYNKPQQSLSPEGLSSLYSMNPNNINQYYSQQMYFQPQTASNYPAIGFSKFMQQPNFNSQLPGYSSTYYPPSNMQSNNWSPSSSAVSTVSMSTPTQSTEQKVVLSVTQEPERSVPRTPKPSTNSSDNLIDFDVDDSKDSANILRTFDPLESNRSSTDDTENSYYTDQDPFDYIYSGGTQYSDPLYDAVVRSDHSITSPKSQTPQEISEYYVAPPDVHKPPPLPPRNHQSDTHDEADRQNEPVAQYSKKLYENVTHLKKFDSDLISFYTMVKRLRSSYVFDDDETNVGHIIAAELDSKYMNVASIKLLVYPSLECFAGKFIEPFSDRNQENYQKIEGYANPIVFTCDIDSNIIHVIIHVLVDLEGKVTGTAEDFALKTIGSQEWLAPDSSLSRLEYIQSNIKLERDIQLGLFPKQNKSMKVIARTRQDDLRDAEIKFENILPKEAVSSISYDTLMILLETLEMEIDKLESAASDNLTLHPSGVVQGVKAICALLGCIDTLELFLAINNLKEACVNHSQSFQVRVSCPVI